MNDGTVVMNNHKCAREVENLSECIICPEVGTKILTLGNTSQKVQVQKNISKEMLALITTEEEATVICTHILVYIVQKLQSYKRWFFINWH